MELLAGLEPAASTYAHPSAAAALGTPVSKRRALPFELQERKRIWSIVPDSNRCLSIGNATVSNHLTNRLVGDADWSGRTELNCHHEFPRLGCCVTPHPEM